MGSALRYTKACTPHVPRIQGMMDRIHADDARSAAIDELVRGLTARLRPSCAAMPPTEFAAMVRAIAERTDRWNAYPPRTPPPGPT